MDTSQVYSSTSTGSAMGDQNQASSGGRGGRRRELETLSVEIRNYPKDLLQSFTSTDRHTAPQQRSEMEERRNEEEETGEGEGEGEDKDVEFNLGLSLGGRFGLDKSHRGLIRSSSIAGSIPCLGKEEGEGEGSAALARTCSLPTATEEEWRRRKATLRRMEARRRRSQKQRTANAKETGLPPPPNPKPGFFRSLQGLLAHHHCSRQSADSQGGTSSAASPLDSKPIQGEATTPTSSQSMQIQDAMVGPSSSKQSETPEQRNKKKKKKEEEEEEEEEGGSSGMEDMPSVFTIGDGPNGRKVEGILYRYARGEQVRIMCVCHGTFFSPSEFVKHAGGTNVDHPHRHIVVYPSSFSFP